MKKQHNVDCGWAWVVLAAACLERLLGSIVFLSGIYYVVFLEAFQQSPGLVAWCTALHFSMTCLIGPVASGVVSILGIRWTTFLGAFMMVIGFFTSAFVTSAMSLLISFGIVAGGGSGFTYVSAFIALGYSFNKYRKIAYAIACTSVGFGTMIFAPLTQFLIDEYGWQGCVIITAGIMSHLFLIGAVYRPIDFNDDFEDCNEIVAEKSEKMNDNEMQHREPSTTHINKNNSSEVLSFLSTKTDKKNGRSDLSYKSSFTSHYDIDKIKQKLHKNLDDNVSRSHPNIAMNKEPHSSCDGRSKHINQFQRKEFLLMGTFSKASSELMLQSCIYLDHHNKFNKDAPQDIQVVGQNKESKKSGLAKYLYKFQALIHWKFPLYTLTVVLFHVGVACIFVHYPIFLISNNVSKSLTSKLMSVIGISSMLSRVLTGLAANSNDIDILIMFMATGGLTGIVLFLAPIFGSNFYGQLLVSVGFGIYSNCMPPLLGPMAIEIVGLRLLNVAFGIQLFLIAVGMITAPLLVGIAYEFTGTYKWSLITAGLAYIVGALLMMLLALGKRDDHLSTISDPNDA